MTLANEQFGVVARRQLRALEVPPKVIDGWVARKLLHVWHRGVYAVGHRMLGANGRRKAAELAGGEQAALCLATALDHAGVRPNASARIHLWVHNQRGRKLNGITPHRFSDMLPEDIEVLDGIRTTTPMRSLVDMAAYWDVDEIRRGIARTEELAVFDLRSLDAIVDRRPNRPGIGRLRRALEIYEPEPTLTELEERGMELIRRARLPRAVPQHHTSEGRVDFYFPGAALIVEMDSFRWHRSRPRFAADRARDAEHLAQGIATMRVTWHQAVEPETVERLRRVYRNRLGALTPHMGVKEPRYFRKPS